MSRSRKAGVAACAVAALMFAVPAGASAQIPGVPPGTIPPEVQEQIGPVLTDVITELTKVDPTPLGLAKANAQPGSATASAIDIPGVLTVGKAETTQDTSKVTVLNVGGQDLLVRQGNATGGTYTGPLAPAGDVIDQVNTALCPKGGANQSGCVMLLYSRSTTASNATGTSKTNTAQFKAAKVQLQNSPEGIELLPVSATSNKTRIPFFGNRCTDIATAFLATGSGTLALVSLVGVANAIKVSAFKPCPTVAAP